MALLIQAFQEFHLVPEFHLVLLGQYFRLNLWSQ